MGAGVAIGSLVGSGLAGTVEGVEAATGALVCSGSDVAGAVSSCDTGAPAVGAEADEALHPLNSRNMNSSPSNLVIVDLRHQQRQPPTPNP